MRILVFGAGVLGCNLAHSLFKSKKDVTLLARGDWYNYIKENGLRIKNKIGFGTSKDRIRVISSLEENDEYDVIFVVMQYGQVDNIAEILLKNKTKNIVLVGNNLDSEKYKKMFSSKNLSFGFYSAAGERKDDKVISVQMNKIIIGGDSKEFIDSVFEDSKIKVEWHDKMDEWLKSHVAFILPIAFGVYYSNGNLKNIKKDYVAINKIIDCMVEMYDVIKLNGYEIEPKEDYDYVTVNRKKCFKFLKIAFATFLGKIMAQDHSLNAVNEMNKLRNEFDKLIEKVGAKTPNYNELETYIERYLKK